MAGCDGMHISMFTKVDEDGSWARGDIPAPPKAANLYVDVFVISKFTAECKQSSQVGIHRMAGLQGSIINSRVH